VSLGPASAGSLLKPKTVYSAVVENAVKYSSRVDCKQEQLDNANGLAIPTVLATGTLYSVYPGTSTSRIVFFVSYHIQDLAINLKAIFIPRAQNQSTMTNLDGTGYIIHSFGDSAVDWIHPGPTGY